MNKYELVFIVDGHLAQDQKENVLKQTTDAIVKAEGKVINSQVWLERQKFTFRIKKLTEGTYYLINFEMTGSGLAKLKENLRLNEDVLRHLIVNVG